MPGHVTYVTGFNANSTFSYSVLKLEWTTTRFFIPANPQANPADPNSALTKIGDEAVPWAEDRGEILNKSLLFRRDATSKDDGIASAFLFNDENGMTCWTSFAGGNPSYENRTAVGRLDFVYARLDANELRIISDPNIVIGSTF